MVDNETIINDEIIKIIMKSMQHLTFNNNSWLSMKEAAKYAGVSYNTFIKFRLRGLKICEVEGIKRVSRKEIEIGRAHV